MKRITEHKVTINNGFSGTSYEARIIFDGESNTFKVLGSNKHNTRLYENSWKSKKEAMKDFLALMQSYLIS